MPCQTLEYKDIEVVITLDPDCVYFKDHSAFPGPRDIQSVFIKAGDMEPVQILAPMIVQAMEYAMAMGEFSYAGKFIIDKCIEQGVYYTPYVEEVTSGSQLSKKFSKKKPDYSKIWISGKSNRSYQDNTTYRPDADKFFGNYFGNKQKKRPW